jgi:hypothetical protein
VLLAEPSRGLFQQALGESQLKLQIRLAAVLLRKKRRASPNLVTHVRESYVRVYVVGRKSVIGTSPIFSGLILS